MSAYLLLKISHNNLAPPDFPQVNDIGIYSEESPTCFSGERYLLLEKEAGVDYSTAREALLARCRSTPWLAWVLPFIEYNGVSNRRGMIYWQQKNAEATEAPVTNAKRKQRKLPLGKRSAS